MLHKPRPVPSWIGGEHSGMGTGFCRVLRFSRNSVPPSTVPHTHSLYNHRRRIIFAPVSVKNQVLHEQKQTVFGPRCRQLLTEHRVGGLPLVVLVGSAAILLLYSSNKDPCWSQWPRGLRRRSTATRLLRSWVRIPPGHGCLSVVNVVCCQVEVSATS